MYHFKYSAYTTLESMLNFFSLYFLNCHIAAPYNVFWIKICYAWVSDAFNTSCNLVSLSFAGSVWHAHVHRAYRSAVLGWHTQHQEPLWSRCMKGMPSWQAALHNTWPDENTVTAECIGEKNKLHGWLPGHISKDFSITELMVTVMLGVGLKWVCT